MRILLVTRHYPPAVSGGAKRPFLLAQAMRAQGAEVFVVAPSLPDGEPGRAAPHPNRDPQTAAPAGASPSASLVNLARELLLWPDPDIRWCRRAAGVAVEAAPWRPDWIWTTSPPESIHAAGFALKRRFGARWLADFRDHWLERPHRRERRAWHRRIGEAALARRWLGACDLVSAVDPVVAVELRSLGAKDPHVAPHFAPAIAPAPIALPANDLNVVHTGSIAMSDPDAAIADLLAPFAAALQTNPSLRLHLVGRLNDAERAAIAASPAAPRITEHGVRPYPEALGFQRAADALVLVGSPKTHVPPSKVVEYLTADVPIVVCGRGDWRADPRIEDRDPAETLAALRKGARRAQRAPPPSADAVAANLLARMRA